jgi:hypothetical protein
MESRKIQRLKFVSDKIEGGDYKREVMCIYFDHPTKKNELVWDSPWEAAMAGVGAPLMAACQARERGERGERRRWAGARLGARLGAWEWLLGGGAQEGGLGVGCLCCSRACWSGGRREGRRKQKERRKEKEEKKRYGKNFKLENFWKIKDNLWSWSKIIFYKKSYMSNYK